MRKKKLLLCVAVSSIFFSCPVYAGTVEDVENYLSVLDPNEITFDINEISYASDEKFLDIAFHLAPGSKNTMDILEQKNNLIVNMMEEDWFDYNSIIDNDCVVGQISTTTFYKPDENVAICTAWIEQGLEYTDLENGYTTRYNPSFRQEIPYEENIPLHMYNIAKDIVNSNFGTFCTYPDYYSEYQDDAHISYNDTIGEVSGTVTVDGEDHMFCTQFTYSNTGGANYTYDATYIFIDGVGCSGTYSPM